MVGGSVSCELEVNAPASLMWDLYKGLGLAAAIEEGLTDLVEKIDAHGDGSVGTVINVKFKPGAVPFSYYKERFTKVDHEKRVKENEVFEGGYCDLGFSKYFIRFEIVDKDHKSCITKATTEYELKEDADPKLASLVSVEQMMGVMHLAANKVVSKTNL